MLAAKLSSNQQRRSGDDGGVREMGANSQHIFYPDSDVIQTVSANPLNPGFIQQLSVYSAELG